MVSVSSAWLRMRPRLTELACPLWQLASPFANFSATESMRNHGAVDLYRGFCQDYPFRSMQIIRSDHAFFRSEFRGLRYLALASNPRIRPLSLS